MEGATRRYVAALYTADYEFWGWHYYPWIHEFRDHRNTNVVWHEVPADWSTADVWELIQSR